MKRWLYPITNLIIILVLMIPMKASGAVSKDISTVRLNNLTKASVYQVTNLTGEVTPVQNYYYNNDDTLQYAGSVVNLVSYSTATYHLSIYSQLPPSWTGYAVITSIQEISVEVLGGDIVSPGTISDLTATSGSASGTVNLSWTAPGDDGSSGTATTYIVRYAGSAIDSESAWNAAADVTGEPVPMAAGSAQSMTAGGLTPGQSYYFGIKTRDEAPNTSGLSNSPNAFAGTGISQCIAVTVVDSGWNVYLPLIRNSQTSQSFKEPGQSDTITVSENTGGCLKVVGDTIHFTLNAGQTGGAATVDIGGIHQGIMLYDDGTHGDGLAGDGIYEREYIILAGDDSRSQPVYGHWYPGAGLPAVLVRAPGSVSIADWASGKLSTAPVGEITELPDGSAHYIKDRLIIGFRDATTDEQIRDVLSGHNLTLASWLPPIQSYEVQLSSGQNEESIKIDLATEPEVEYTERNWMMYDTGISQAISDTLRPIFQDYLHVIRADLAWTLSKGSATVQVCIIDSGVNANHEDLNGKFLSTIDLESGSGNHPEDERKHGTWVAGIIAAQEENKGISGVAPFVMLRSYRVNNVAQMGTALMQATSDGCEVINISGGTEPGISNAGSDQLKSLRKAIEFAYTSNVVIIASAGYANNTGTIPGMEIEKRDTGLSLHAIFPASYPHVLAVGFSTITDTRHIVSNYGSQVVFAPGVDIISTANTGGYKVKSGNSFSAPQVSALAALILSEVPGLAPQDVMRIITSTTDLKGTLGLGRINAYRALYYAKYSTIPGTNPLPNPPTNFDATLNADGNYVDLSWINSADSDLAGVYIYRMESDEVSHDYLDDVKLGYAKLDGVQTVMLNGAMITGTSYRDFAVQPGKYYHYFIFSVDSLGQESALYQYRYIDYIAWVPVGPGSASGGGISKNSGSSNDPTMAIAPDGQVYAAWTDETSGTSQIYLKRWNGIAWEQTPAGSAQGSGVSQSTNGAYNASIATDTGGIPYIAYEDAASDGIRVRFLSSNAWPFLGQPVNNGSNCVTNIDPVININDQNQIYVAWFCVTTPKDMFPRVGSTYMKRWNGSAWVAAFNGSASGDGIGGNFLWGSIVKVAPNGTFYFVLPGISRIHLQRWDGNNLTLITSCIDISSPDISVDSGNNLFVSWNWSGSNGDQEVFIKRWNGSSLVSMDGDFIPDGLASDTPGDSEWPSLAVNNQNRPHVAWVDYTDGNWEIYVKHWENGWKEKGNQSAQSGGISKSAGVSTNPILVFAADGTLYVVWVDETDGDSEIYIRRFIE